MPRSNRLPNLAQPHNIGTQNTTPVAEDVFGPVVSAPFNLNQATRSHTVAAQGVAAQPDGQTMQARGSYSTDSSGTFRHAISHNSDNALPNSRNGPHTYQSFAYESPDRCSGGVGSPGHSNGLHAQSPGQVSTTSSDIRMSDGQRSPDMSAVTSSHSTPSSAAMDTSDDSPGRGRAGGSIGSPGTPSSRGMAISENFASPRTPPSVGMASAGRSVGSRGTPSSTGMAISDDPAHPRSPLSVGMASAGRSIGSRGTPSSTGMAISENFVHPRSPLSVGMMSVGRSIGSHGTPSSTGMAISENSAHSRSPLSASMASAGRSLGSRGTPSSTGMAMSETYGRPRTPPSVGMASAGNTHRSGGSSISHGSSAMSIDSPTRRGRSSNAPLQFGRGGHPRDQAAGMPLRTGAFNLNASTMYGGHSQQSTNVIPQGSYPRARQQTGHMFTGSRQVLTPTTNPRPPQAGQSGHDDSQIPSGARYTSEALETWIRAHPGAYHRCDRCGALFDTREAQDHGCNQHA